MDDNGYKLLMEKKAIIHKKLLKDFNFFSEGYLMKKLYVEAGML